MHITDLENNDIEITDLAMALLQADDYRHYRLAEPSAMQNYLQLYWEDFYQKLLLLDLMTKHDSL